MKHVNYRRDAGEEALNSPLTLRKLKLVFSYLWTKLERNMIEALWSFEPCPARSWDKNWQKCVNLKNVRSGCERELNDKNLKLENSGEFASDVSTSTIVFARLQNKRGSYRRSPLNNMIVQPILVVRPRGNCSVAERDFWLVSTGVALVFRPSFYRGLLLTPVSLRLLPAFSTCPFSLSTGRLGCSFLEKCGRTL